MSAPCEHLEDLALAPMPEGGCFECLAIGDTWVHLRFCVECEMTRCCNDSKNQHSMKHALADGHALTGNVDPLAFIGPLFNDQSALAKLPLGYFAADELSPERSLVVHSPSFRIAWMAAA